MIEKKKKLSKALIRCLLLMHNKLKLMKVHNLIQMLFLN